MVSFALCGALLHQLRTPRHTNGGAAAAVEAADVLLEEEARAEAERAVAEQAQRDRGAEPADASSHIAADLDVPVREGEMTLVVLDERICRFCFGGANEMPGGLISPCLCKGTQARAGLAAGAARGG